MINAWVQKPDYSADDHENVTSDHMLKLWNSLNISELDNELISLKDKQHDYCHWGIGIGHNTSRSIHIYRESIEKNTFNALIEESIPKKVLGIFSVNSKRSFEKKDIQNKDVPPLIEAYFNESPLSTS